MTLLTINTHKLTREQDMALAHTLESYNIPTKKANCLNLTAKERKTMQHALNCLIDREEDSVNRTVLFNKIKSCR